MDINRLACLYIPKMIPQIYHKGKLKMTYEKLDVNTLDGWNKLSDINNKKSFIHIFGRAPIDETELYSWVDGLAAEMIASTPKPADFEWRLVTMDDKAWLTKYL